MQDEIFEGENSASKTRSERYSVHIKICIKVKIEKFEKNLKNYENVANCFELASKQNVLEFAENTAYDSTLYLKYIHISLCKVHIVAL